MQILALVACQDKPQGPQRALNHCGQVSYGRFPLAEQRLEFMEVKQSNRSLIDRPPSAWHHLTRFWVRKPETSHYSLRYMDAHYLSCITGTKGFQKSNLSSYLRPQYAWKQTLGLVK